MKITTTFIVEIVSLSVLFGCSPAGRSFEDRRDFSIQSAKDGLITFTNVIPAKYNKDNLSALMSIGNGIVKTPHVSSAILLRRSSAAYNLYVFWIENYPSVNAVELKLNNQTRPIVMPAGESQTKLNEKDAETSIVFSKEQTWDQTSELWKDLEEIRSTNELMVRLLRAGNPVTDWHAVDFYRDRKWITNAAIKK
jgi:hypothetical protein